MRNPKLRYGGVLIALAISLALPETARADTRVGPPAGDILSAWIKARLTESAIADDLVSDTAVTGDMVTAPSSIYSRLRHTPYAFRGTIWQRALSDLSTQGTPLTRLEATEALAWDLGMTNGYPRIGELSDLPDLGAPWAGTQLVKAGVSEDVARKSLALAGHGAFAVAANYAVAVQILVEKLACYDPGLWAALGLRSDVLGRYMMAKSLADLSDYDLIYLVRLLQTAMSTWNGGEITELGRRQLPAALRVARVAAAYRDMQGYTDDPCSTDGQARVGIAGLDPEQGQPMCLVAANDRAVLRWYLDKLDAQVDPDHSNFVTSPALAMTRFLRPMRPLWLGVLDKSLRAYASHVEVVESLVADGVTDSDMSSESSSRYAERRALFLCSKEFGA
ncbi:hypothetical protein L2Y96_02445 [Luteibacter aegosomaticola]|uniref:hypothetical protein n=1 Tax=Luteibacter aegosomaticola TaxID=2911538 RepID=UPI001FF9CE0D|nr:hypothetical protein [Luteibacter aegosomaticola]UPG90652.1 hypothetical protein L2Y96_02445 [Luteibacter aegosomaticola]